MSSMVPTSQPEVASRSSRGGREARTASKLTLKRQYLIFYNLISFLLWAALLTRIVPSVLPSSTTKSGLSGSNTLKSSTHSVGNIYSTSGTFAKWIQTLALAEIVHSLFGIVRAPIMTTAMQVASRLLLVWGIVHLFGDRMLRGTAGFQAEDTLRNQQAYLGMLVAWGVTECIRYAYFVFFLAVGKVPAILSWLRYNTFFAAYPLGISCECFLVYKAIPYAKQLDPRFALLLKAILAIYVPGSYILYTHMMAQRRRIMRSK